MLQNSPEGRKINVAPYAHSLIEGHRDFGYNIQTALADIIDNAISAKATQVELKANSVSETPWVAIIDDGEGMTERELIEAMRFGSKNPTDTRDPKELGRFGLGLKSASFSQCRCLTVITRKNGATVCARWDLDQVAESNNWTLELIDNTEDLTGSEFLGSKGTVVVWEKLDRLGGATHSKPEQIKHINSELSKAERHLRLVFHRFLEGASPKVTLFLNSRKLEPIDPVASNHPSTQTDPEECIELANGSVRIRSYTLPHFRKMTKAEWDELGGPEGHLKSQGLYVYREDRLIIVGSWLGLIKQTELTKLSRITIDIPNTMDSEWKIDVKKSSAQLPLLVRKRLTRIIERFVGTSKRTYQSRGQKLVDITRHPIWNRVQKGGNVIFKPNLEHPVFQTFASKLSDDLRNGFESCLRLLGSGLPIDALHAELVGNAESVAPDRVEESDIKQVIYDLAGVYLANGVASENLKYTMQSYPLIQSNWEVSEGLINDYLKEINR